MFSNRASKEKKQKQIKLHAEINPQLHMEISAMLNNRYENRKSLRI